MSTRTRIILFASLALNLFLAGLIAGALILGPRGQDRHDRRPGSRSFWAAAEQLPQTERDALRELLRRQAATLRPRMRAARQARREASEAMAKDPYDAAAVIAALTRARDEEQALRRAFDEAVVGFAARLTPSERAVLAEGLRRRRGGGGGGGSKKREPQPPEGSGSAGETAADGRSQASP